MRHVSKWKPQHEERSIKDEWNVECFKQFHFQFNSACFAVLNDAKERRKFQLDPEVKKSFRILEDEILNCTSLVPVGGQGSVIPLYCCFR